MAHRFDDAEVYIEHLEQMAFLGDGHRCDVCEFVYDVDDMHEARLTFESVRSTCKSCHAQMVPA